MGNVCSQALLLTIPGDRPKAAAFLESDNWSVFKHLRWKWGKESQRNNWKEVPCELLHRKKDVIKLKDVMAFSAQDKMKYPPVGGGEKSKAEADCSM